MKNVIKEYNLINAKFIPICLLILNSFCVFGQKQLIEQPSLAIYKLLTSESFNLKDSLAIYALNFEISLTRNEKGAVITNILANDSLAFSLFPSYKKFSTIDFRPLMGTKNNIKVIIPILIYGSSYEKMEYKDKNGNPLIDLNAAVNAAYALYRPFKYNNMKDSREFVGHLQYKSSIDKKSDTNFWDAITLEPVIITIKNIR